MYKIAIDYKGILKDRVIIITGVGRSGTTLLGKILGSMRPAQYFFEPTALKWLPFLPTVLPLDDDAEYVYDALRATLVEDYILPQIQGRNLNLNPLDDSYTYQYATE